MTTSPPRPIAAGAWPHLALLGLLLLGVVAMHGLNGHGTALGSEPMAHTAVASMSDASARPAMHSTERLTADPAHGMGGAMAGLCVAVIGIGIGLGLVALANRRRRTRHVARGARPGCAAAASRSRDPDPPSLIHLSIQRC